MDFIPASDKPYTCSITERERILKARTNASMEGKKVDMSYDAFHTGKGKLEFVPVSERIDRGESKVSHHKHHTRAKYPNLGRPQGIKNIHRGMDWIPNHEKRDPNAYANEGPDGHHEEEEVEHTKSHDQGFDWVPDSERARGGGNDTIIGGSLGGGWNSQFIIKRESYRNANKAKKKQPVRKTPYARNTGVEVKNGIPNKYHLKEKGRDLWSGVSSNYGPQPLW